MVGGHPGMSSNPSAKPGQTQSLADGYSGYQSVLLCGLVVRFHPSDVHRLLSG